MSVNSFDQVLSIKMKPTLGKKLLIVIPHLVICLILLIILNVFDLSHSFYVFALLCILFSFFFYTRLYLTLSHGKSIYNINKDLSNRWSISLNDNVRKNVLITGSSFISKFWIILNFIDSSDKQNYTVLLTPDSVSENDYRRLKVMVKTKKLDL